MVDHFDQPLFNYKKQHIMKKITVLASLFFALSSIAQDRRPDNWFNLDATKDNVNGVSTEKTYEELLKGKNQPLLLLVF